jgi:hypothetical protein
MLYVDLRENSQSYFHTLQALDVSPTCDAADVKSIIHAVTASRKLFSDHYPLDFCSIF